jgi:hypothetical protein
MSDQEHPKTPSEYRSIAQLTGKGLSSDYLNYFMLRSIVDAIKMFKGDGNTAKATKLFNTLKQHLISVPTYSERYLNENELAQAAEYGVKKEELISSDLQPKIQRLDKIAERVRQIGEEMTEDDYEGFLEELKKLEIEAEKLIV